jgi:hypothetical protein
MGHLDGREFFQIWVAQSAIVNHRPLPKSSLTASNWGGLELLGTAGGKQAANYRNIDNLLVHISTLARLFSHG